VLKLQAGSQVGHYFIVREIGSGGMAVVYEAFDPDTDTDVAIKVTNDPISKDAAAAGQVWRELGCASRVRHENVVWISETPVVMRDHPCIVMELLEGKDLFDLLKEWKEVPAGDRRRLYLVALLCDVLKGLHAIHECIQDGEDRLVHRDIKPSNIIITFAGVAKVVDLGIAKFMSVANSIQSPIIRGTAAYMAPEIARGETYDLRADICSMGLVLFEAWFGYRLWTGYGSLEIYQLLKEVGIVFNPQVELSGPDALLREIVVTAINNDVDRRYPTAKLFENALDDFLKCTLSPTWRQAATDYWKNCFDEQKLDLESKLSAVRKRVREQAKQSLSGVSQAELPTATGRQTGRALVATRRARGPLFKSVLVVAGIVVSVWTGVLIYVFSADNKHVTNGEADQTPTKNKLEQLTTTETTDEPNEPLADEVVLNLATMRDKPDEPVADAADAQKLVVTSSLLMPVEVEMTGPIKPAESDVNVRPPEPSSAHAELAKRGPRRTTPPSTPTIQHLEPAGEPTSATMPDPIPSYAEEFRSDRHR